MAARLAAREGRGLVGFRLCALASSWAVALLAFLVPLSWSALAAAHDPAIQQLTVFFDGSGRVRAELVLDPHSGPLQSLPRGQAAGPAQRQTALRAALDGVRSALHLQQGKRSLEVSPQAKELWQPGGPTPGDLLTLGLPSADPNVALRVTIGAPLVPLVVTVRQPSAEHRAQQSSTFLDSPGTIVLRRSDRVEADGGWRPGGAESFRREWDAARQPDVQAASKSTLPIAEPGSLLTWSTAARFVRFGVKHVLFEGYDHALFVLALSIGALRARRLLLVVTCFTLAHSLSLFAAQWLRWVPPASVVEPLIAFSIVLAAGEVVWLVRRPAQTQPHAVASSATGRHATLWLVAVFGLVHGLGFSGTLGQLSLTALERLLSVASFNVGVELGQLVFVALGFGSMLLLRSRPELQLRARQSGGALIAALGSWMLLTRLWP